jgi:hypothetical protein
MERQPDETVFDQAAESITKAVKGRCSNCGRGATGMAAPDLDDLEAIIAIRDGFNKHRRSFSPLVEEQFRRLDRTIGYLHRMIEGGRDG